MAVGLLGLTSTGAEAVWPTYQGNNLRTGVDASQPAFQSVADGVGPALLDGGLLFQGGKDGVGYLLRASALGGVGGQAFMADVCGGSGIYGGTAYLAPYLYVPGAGRLVALRVTLSPPSFAEAWHVPMSFAGPPIVSGGAVWTIARSGDLFGFELGTGVLRFQAALGPVKNFAAPAAAGGRLFVPVDSRIRAFTLLSGPFATVTPASLAF